MKLTLTLGIIQAAQVKPQSGCARVVPGEAKLLKNTNPQPRFHARHGIFHITVQ